MSFIHGLLICIPWHPAPPISPPNKLGPTLLPIYPMPLAIPWVRLTHLRSSFLTPIVHHLALSWCRGRPCTVAASSRYPRTERGLPCVEGCGLPCWLLSSSPHPGTEHIADAFSSMLPAPCAIWLHTHGSPMIPSPGRVPCALISCALHIGCPSRRSESCIHGGCRSEGERRGSSVVFPHIVMRLALWLISSP